MLPPSPLVHPSSFTPQPPFSFNHHHFRSRLVMPPFLNSSAGGFGDGGSGEYSCGTGAWAGVKRGHVVYPRALFSARSDMPSFRWTSYEVKPAGWSRGVFLRFHGFAITFTCVFVPYFPRQLLSTWLSVEFFLFYLGFYYYSWSFFFLFPFLFFLVLYFFSYSYLVYSSHLFLFFSCSYFLSFYLFLFSYLSLFSFYFLTYSYFNLTYYYFLIVIFLFLSFILSLFILIFDDFVFISLVYSFSFYSHSWSFFFLFLFLFVSFLSFIHILFFLS